MKKRSIVLALLFSALITAANAELAEIGINPLRMELGGRPLGMGAAFAGLADDMNAVLYNPGGLAWAKGVSLTIQDPQNISALQAYPNGEGSSVGLAIVKTTLSDVPIQGGAANSESNVVIFSYGTKLTFIPALYNNPFFKRLGIGVSIKGLAGQTLRRTGMIDRSASGWDADLGVLWKGSEWWSVGASLQNILPMKTLGGGVIRWDVGGEEGIPSIIKIGGAAKLISDMDAPIFMEGKELLLSAEMDLNSSKATLMRVGGEFNFNRRFYLRGGVMQQSSAQGESTDINVGAGMRFEEWGIDIAHYREPVRNARYLAFSFLFLPREWVVVKKLEMEKPSLMLERPIEKLSIEDNLVTYDDRIEISGKVKPGVEVYINGLRASLAADNSFKVVVPLQMQKNLIVVEARFEGEKKTWKYKVFRKAKINVAEERELAELIKRAASEREKAALASKEAELKRKKEWAEDFVTMGIIEITPEANFVMEAAITRGELASWLVNAAGMRVPEVDRDLYKDVPKDHPLAPYIKVATELKLFKPFPDGTFRPGAFVSKAEGDEIFKRFGKKR